MQSFEYEALDASGKLQQGQLEGHSDRQVRDQLRKKKLIPVQVSPVAVNRLNASTGRTQSTKSNDKAGTSIWQILTQRKLKITDLSLFTQQLSTLLGSGIPLSQVLEIMVQQSESAPTRRWLTRVRTQVLEGYPLGVAISRSGLKVPQEYIATVSAGEETGYLSQVLTQLGDSVLRQDKLRKKVTAALIYPAVMICFCVAIVSFLLVGVLPKVVTVFQDLDRALPTMTQNLIGFSQWLTSYWQLLLVLCGISIIFIHRLLSIESIRHKWHLVLLKFPFTRKWEQDLSSARWSSTLSVLISSGVPVVKALSISAEVVTFLPYKYAVETVGEKVRQGHTLNQSMHETGVFPILLRYLVSSGEQSSSLGPMLSKAADQYENNIQNRISTFLSLLEPMMIIVMGGLIMLVVLSIMLPIFEMNQGLG